MNIARLVCQIQPTPSYDNYLKRDSVLSVSFNNNSLARKLLQLAQTSPAQPGLQLLAWIGHLNLEG